MIRTFIAVEIPHEIKSHIADFQRELKPENFPIRWVKPNGIHITLKFLGEISEDLVENIKTEIFEKPPVREPFEIMVSGTGVFPNNKKPRVLWTGVTNGAEELAALAGKIDNRLGDLFDIQKETRALRPHLTIGRVKKSYRIKNLERFISPDILYAGSFSVNEIVLMKSVLTPAGPEYTPLAIHALT